MTIEAIENLIKAGKKDEARKMFEAELERAKSEPDTLTVTSDGKVSFTRRGKKVELDSEGNWHPQKRPARTAKVVPPKS
jgi:hypothetical protein